MSSWCGTLSDLPNSEGGNRIKRSCPFSENILISINSSDHSKQPLPEPDIFECVYALHKQSFLQTRSHFSRVQVCLNLEPWVSGNFTFENLLNPSPVPQSKGVRCRHPWSQSTTFHWFGNVGSNPFKHSQAGESSMLQLAYGPQRSNRSQLSISGDK